MTDGETIYGLPTLNYYRQNVKPEYITPEIDENGLGLIPLRYKCGSQKET